MKLPLGAYHGIFFMLTKFQDAIRYHQGPTSQWFIYILPFVIFMSYIARCCYKHGCIKKPHIRHPIARLWRWDMECLLWLRSVVYILPLLSQRWFKHHGTLDCIIMALDCIQCHVIFKPVYSIRCLQVLGLHLWRGYSGTAGQVPEAYVWPDATLCLHHSVSTPKRATTSSPSWSRGRLGLAHVHTQPRTSAGHHCHDDPRFPTSHRKPTLENLWQTVPEIA